MNPSPRPLPTLGATWLRQRVEESHGVYLSFGLDRSLGPWNPPAARQAHELAQRFRMAPTLAAGRAVLGGMSAPAPWLPPVGQGTVNLLLGGSTLGVLRQVAGAAAHGWHLVVEECEFAREFLGQLAGWGVGELQSLRQFPRAAVEQLKRQDRRSMLFVALVDRPMLPSANTPWLPTSLGPLAVTDLDGRLAQLPFERVGLANGVPWRASESGAVQTASDAALQTLATEIASEPGAYLGWRMLATHGHWYAPRLFRKGRSLAQCYLRYAATVWPEQRAELAGAVTHLAEMRAS